MSLRILNLISSVDPGGGGPIEAVVKLHAEFVHAGHHSEVASMDDPQAPWVAECPAPVHALGPAASGYGYTPRLLPWLRENAANYDAVIVNGLWQFHGLAAWRAFAGTSTPYYVFTHGMLDPWFKREYPLKHLKKWLYWPWAEYRVLRDARAALFTCEEERLLARQSFWLYRCNEEVTSLGTAPPPSNGDELAAEFLAVYPALKGKRIALYLSRLHEKKGCDLLIEAFARIAADPDVVLVMAGPDQTGWMAELKALAERLGISDRITWTGMLRGNLKWGAFYAAEVFCLPSHQENFGIVVAEALACGLPVLISDKVNIWREVEQAGAGIVKDDSLSGTEQLLRQWLAMRPQEFHAMQKAAKQCFDHRFRIDQVAKTVVSVIERTRTV